MTKVDPASKDGEKKGVEKVVDKDNKIKKLSEKIPTNKENVDNNENKK